MPLESKKSFGEEANILSHFNYTSLDDDMRLTQAQRNATEDRLFERLSRYDAVLERSMVAAGQVVAR